MTRKHQVSIFFLNYYYQHFPVALISCCCWPLCLCLYNHLEAKNVWHFQIAHIWIQTGRVNLHITGFWIKCHGCNWHIPSFFFWQPPPPPILENCQLQLTNHSFIDFSLRLLFWKLLSNNMVSSVQQISKSSYWLFMFRRCLQEAHWLRKFEEKKNIYHVNSLLCCRVSETIAGPFLSHCVIQEIWEHFSVTAQNCYLVFINVCVDLCVCVRVLLNL